MPPACVQDELDRKDAMTQEFISDDLSDRLDSPPPRQVVDFSAYGLDLSDMSFVSLGEPAEDPQSRLQHVLSGQGYADGQPAWMLPIVSRKQPYFDWQAFVPLLEGQLAGERVYVYEFAGTWLAMAQGTKEHGRGPTPLEEESTILLTLMSMSIPMLVRAIAHGDSERQKKILEGMEAALNGLFCLRDIDVAVRRRYM
ncbi:hypothetical protein C8T65DRAFT_745809 [Cerioporus squamosus]|nr:hypothetical protein C8T65DRAFT_745809 [Cerioporus squamosus]